MGIMRHEGCAVPEMILVALGLGAAVVGASFISGIFGMAGGIILLAILLGAGMDVASAMAFHGVAMGASNLWRIWLWRQYVDTRIVVRFVLGALVAFGLFMMIRLVPDRATVLILLGIMPFLALILPERIVPQANRPGGALLAGLSTMSATFMAGVAGPLLDAFFVRANMDRRSVIATKAGCAFVSNILKTTYFALASAVPLTLDVSLGVVAVVAAFIGTIASQRVLESMTDQNFRRWTQVIVLSIGTVSIVTGVADLISR